MQSQARLAATWIGRIGYREAWQLQKELVAQRAEGSIEDRLLLLEHDAVLTLGRQASEEHVLATPRELRRREIEVIRVERGGEVTYHGPGQLVGYPIVDLGHRPDVVGYVRKLEDIIVQACGDIGVTGLGRNPVNSGVWAGDRKVCAIGIRVTRARVTLHGFALNCTTDLSWFDAILPCGLADHGVTSLTQLAGREVTAKQMASLVAARFGQAFGVTLVPGDMALVGAGAAGKTPSGA